LESEKRAATAEEIQAEIAMRLKYSASSEHPCRGCGVPTPVLLAERRGDGVNWGIAAFPDVPDGCAAFLMKVLSEVMYAYDLTPSPPPTSDNKKRKRRSREASPTWSARQAVRAASRVDARRDHGS
jgi:hypothetical protein